MRSREVLKLYDSLTEIDSAWLQEMWISEQPVFSIKKRILWLVAAVLSILFFCGFAAYQAGLFDLWLQRPSPVPEAVVQTAVENQIRKDYALVVEVYEVSVDDTATERAKQMYMDSDLTAENGWSEAYLNDNLVVVHAKYYAEYDHEKTFLPDGDVDQYFLLVRDEDSGEWRIWDSTTNGDPFNYES